MRIAIVHDHLLEFGGAERVFVSLARAFAGADLYTSYLNVDGLGVHKKEIENLTINTSWANRVPGMKRLHSPLRFMYPLIWESLDLRGYDVVITSSATAMCRGVITRPETLNICYMHHPPRYLYNYETAMEWRRHAAIRIYAALINHGLLQWDYLAAQRVDHMISNSKETQKRVAKFYRLESDVIYPPVHIPEKQSYNPNGYYVTVSRLARAKHVEVLIHAANTLRLPLTVVGTGRDLEYLKSMSGPTITFAGNVSDEQLVTIYQGARAFLFASQDEEFGIAPVEAMGYGLPVIAYASGGLKETVKDGRNGFLFDELTSDSLSSKLQTFEALSEQDRVKMSNHARDESEKYSEQNYIQAMQKYVEKALKNRKS
jgi:glycosyltransferase involved in cell wall biosynthesis